MRPERITSRRNPLLQQIRRLLASRRARQEEGLFVGDGTKLLEEAAHWYGGLETVILTDTLPVPELPPDTAVYQVPADVMESLSPMKTPQGALFLCRLQPPAPQALTPGCLILDGIQDPGNLGTILRTADALEVPVVLTPGCADPYSWKTVRASMGAVFRTQPVQGTEEEILALCRTQGIPLAVTALSPRARDIRQEAICQYAVVIGSEGQGVSKLFLEQGDAEWIIPMNPRCESLNAAVAAAIVMWQMQTGRPGWRE